MAGEQTQVNAGGQQTNEPKDDLVTKVSAFKLTDTNSQETNAGFDINALQNIKTPEEAKAFAEASHKSFERGYQKKYQDLAREREEVDRMKQELNTWTPDRVRSLTQDPNFVRAAQSITGQTQLSEDEYSALNEKEKAEFNALRNDIVQLRRINSETLRLQQDRDLSARYSNYDPSLVDGLTKQLINGSRNATREDVWKVADYDEAVKRAYQMGLEDRKQNIQEQINSFSMTGNATVQPVENDKPKREQSETPVNYFKRLGRWRLTKLSSERSKK